MILTHTESIGIISGALNTSIQIFFAHRIYYLSKRALCLPMSIVTTSLIYLGDLIILLGARELADSTHKGLCIRLSPPYELSIQPQSDKKHRTQRVLVERPHSHRRICLPRPFPDQ
ncbi:hypothetical protein BC834DRAFT_912955 [Gloeopeniophorella convolvens]|nr:hypothetical protein BC834DRAFT_912955 [Gloeopeniophorella convolvens]